MPSPPMASGIAAPRTSPFLRKPSAFCITAAAIAAAGLAGAAAASAAVFGPHRSLAAAAVMAAVAAAT